MISEKEYLKALETIKQYKKQLRIGGVSNSLLPCGFEKCVIDIKGDKMCDFCKYKKQ